MSLRAKYEYIVTFAPFLMQTITNSEVFLYPELLPKIPYKCNYGIGNTKNFYLDSEDQYVFYFIKILYKKLIQNILQINSTRSRTIPSNS